MRESSVINHLFDLQQSAKLKAKAQKEKQTPLEVENHSDTFNKNQIISNQFPNCPKTNQIYFDPQSHQKNYKNRNIQNLKTPNEYLDKTGFNRKDIVSNQNPFINQVNKNKLKKDKKIQFNPKVKVGNEKPSYFLRTKKFSFELGVQTACDSSSKSEQEIEIMQNLNRQQTMDLLKEEGSFTDLKVGQELVRTRPFYKQKLMNEICQGSSYFQNRYLFMFLFFNFLNGVNRSVFWSFKFSKNQIAEVFFIFIIL